MIWLAIVAFVFVAGGTWLVAKTLQTRLVVFGIGAAAVAGYWFVGHPGMSDRPLDARLAEVETTIRANPEKLTAPEAIAIAERRARDKPEEAMPHLIIARLYEGMAQEAQAAGQQLIQAGDEKGAGEKAAAMKEDLQRAQDAYGNALKRDPGNIDAVTSLADLRFKTTFEVDDFTTRLYQAAFAAQPDHFRLGYMAGIGLWVQGRKAEAQAIWDDIEKRAPAGGPERQMFAALKDMFGIDKPATLPTTP